MLEPPLLITRFTVPPVRPTLLPRKHLIEVLDQSRSFPLILISAPTGFGKTTLLSAWASQHSQVAWLSLDEQDNDPARFWTYTIAALRHNGARLSKGSKTCSVSVEMGRHHSLCKYTEKIERIQGKFPAFFMYTTTYHFYKP